MSEHLHSCIYTENRLYKMISGRGYCSYCYEAHHLLCLVKSLLEYTGVVAVIDIPDNRNESVYDSSILYTELYCLGEHSTCKLIMKN